ncbi:DUF1566 domain-containing protein [Desulfobotulus mexicanus]|uniref:DUF1566 domain-containing protein n=1 Tax=Desulfobotulus mexicanus TaxID=2586642 RepID=A0A5Q4VAB1_9BACT|nr:DUF1566 domain-containing protein [Desulfobotulus mexicanus]TYT74684.1 DUF1566 domain-containing protein [Desulfobotulus mexicanus]
MKEKRVHIKGLFRKKLVIFLGMMVLLGVTGAVQAAQQPFDPSRFQEVAGSNGAIARDTSTGLEWQRCAYGEIWAGSGCSGTAWEGTWDDAVRVTASDGFRVPNIDELKTLAPYDQNVFPGPYKFWSSTPNGSLRIYALGIHFKYGAVGNSPKSDNFRVRLVRAGQ